jgi:glutamate/tyrosine decarboxylase-like PLP-dependent enzyme
MLMAWGKEGLEDRLDRCMAAAARFASFIKSDERLELLGEPHTGVVVWRPRGINIDNFYACLPSGLASQTSISGSRWLRCVAANPNTDIDTVIAAVSEAISQVD